MSSLVDARPRLHAHVRGLAVVAALLAVATLAWASPASARLTGPLAELSVAHPRQRVEVIIQLRHGVGAVRGRALVRTHGGRPGLALPIINGLSARMDAAQARTLAASPLVHAVSLNATIKTQNYNGTVPSRWQLQTSFDQTVGATGLWQHTTGQGVGVAVVDTGVTGNLPDFQASRWNTTSRVIASAVIDPDASTANDTYGHGTAVAGLIAGNGDDRSWGDPLQGSYDGTAPDANLISIKIADDSGSSTVLDAIYGLQFAVDHQQQYNIRVVNLSFRSTVAGSYTSDPLDAAAEQAWMHGIVVVAAAGNLGTESDAVSYAPGNDPYVLTVGASDDQGTSGTADDVQASWSSQGTTQDGVAKPDVLAPGANIITTLAPNSYFASACPSCIVGGDYFDVSGTSLSAPIVAGIAADLIADHPSWTPAEVKGAIVNTAQPLPGGGSEVSAVAADQANGNQLVSDQGLTPSTLIDPDTGDIDPSAASWGAASWGTASVPQTASWSAASWSCLTCSATGDGTTQPTAASWGTADSWTTMWG